MYNLFVTAKDDAWEAPAYEYNLGRAVREGTVEQIVEIYSSFDEDAKAKLCSFPSLFLYETISDEIAQLGWILKIRNHSASVIIEFEIEKVFIPTAPGKIRENRLLLDIEEWEFTRTHWAVKDVDLFSVLLQTNLITKTQIQQTNRSVITSPLQNHVQPLVINPKVFGVPSQPIEKDLVSVMMPFGSNFNSVYEYIQQACRNVGLHCLRADDIWEESTIIQDIFNLLYRSSIVIVDFSARNSNVMYETGVAHTLGRTVIPMAQSIDDVPFDLRHHRCLTYLANNEGLSLMQTGLENRLRNIVDGEAV